MQAGCPKYPHHSKQQTQIKKYTSHFEAQRTLFIAYHTNRHRMLLFVIVMYYSVYEAVDDEGLERGVMMGGPNLTLSVTSHLTFGYMCSRVDLAQQVCQLKREPRARLVEFAFGNMFQLEVKQTT